MADGRVQVTNRGEPNNMSTDYVDQLWDSDDRQQRLADCDVTVVASFWSTPRIESEGKAHDADKGADRVQLYWHCRIDEVYQEYDKVLPERLTIQISPGGDDWVTDEHGVMIEHKDDPSMELVKKGKAKLLQFKGSSFYGKLLGLCNGKYGSWYTKTHVDPMTKAPIILDDGDEVVYDMDQVKGLLKRRNANPRDASIWVGTQWRTRGLGFYYKQTEGTPGVKVMPVAFLGFDQDVASAYVPGSAGSDGSAAVPETGGAAHAELVSETLPGASADLVEQVTGLVSESTSHPEFMRGALKLDEVKANPDLKKLVMDANTGPWSKKGVALPDADPEGANDDTPGDPADEEF